MRLIAEIIITVRLSIVAAVSMWENVFIHFKSKTSFVWKCTALVCSSYLVVQLCVGCWWVQ